MTEEQVKAIKAYDKYIEEHPDFLHPASPVQFSLGLFFSVLWIKSSTD